MVWIMPRACVVIYKSWIEKEVLRRSFESNRQCSTSSGKSHHGSSGAPWKLAGTRMRKLAQKLRSSEAQKLRSPKAEVGSRFAAGAYFCASCPHPILRVQSGGYWKHVGDAVASINDMFLQSTEFTCERGWNMFVSSESTLCSLFLKFWRLLRNL